MTRLFKTLIVISILFSAVSAKAQLTVRDSAVNITMLNPHLSVHFPGGDMKDRFYTSMGVGFGILYKTKTNWVIGGDFQYTFAEEVKNEDEILSNINTSEGFIIDQGGVFANVHFRERGFYTGVKFGRLFPVFGPNPNSGILVMGSLGVLQHKIRIEVAENTAPQLRDDYIKGYDKLTNGPGASLFLGYMMFSNSKLTNFYAGVELIAASTASRRSYDYTIMGYDDTQRLDMLTCVKVGWLVPTYRRAPQKYYIN